MATAVKTDLSKESGSIQMSPLVARARAVASETIAIHADDVDKKARFPQESVEALKAEKLLSAAVPRELGGEGATLKELREICEVLGQKCSSTAMIFAMHQIQVLCLVRHGSNIPYFRDYFKRLVKNQNLIASVTSEAQVGGEMRTSICAVERDGNQFSLTKDATTISYGAEADDLLITARRGPESPQNDQVLVLIEKDQAKLEKKGTWDTMGMRGTMSPPFLVQAKGHVDQIIPVPFSDIASLTMTPVSHILWGGCWLGNATAAAQKARLFVRGQARAKPGTVPPTALRLAELTTNIQTLRMMIQNATREYEELIQSEDMGVNELTSIGYAVRINNLKVSASQLIILIVNQALMTCGITAYKNDSKFSMSRHLRDAYSAALMVGNDRIFATNAALLLVLKDDP